MGGDDSTVLEECVLRILEHGDINVMSESTVRKLAAQETGFDLSVSVYRQLVKRVVRDYFSKESGPKPSDSVKRVVSSNPLNPLPSKRSREAVEKSKDETVEKIKEQIVPQRKLTKQDAVKKEMRYALADMRKDAPLRGKADEIRRSAESKRPVPQKRKRQVISDDEVAISDEEDNGKVHFGVEKHAVLTSKKISMRAFSDEEDAEDEGEVPARVDKHTAQPTIKKKVRNEEDGEVHARVDKHTAQPSIKNKVQDEEDGEVHARVDKHTVQPSIKNKVRDEEDGEVQTRGANGQTFVCKLSETRIVTVEEFKGKILIAIREYYEKDKKLYPSKKGISLTLPQWEALREGIPDIETALKCKRK